MPRLLGSSTQETAMPSPVLYLVCGKIAAGKSTLARELAATQQASVVATAGMPPGIRRDTPPSIPIAPRSAKLFPCKMFRRM